MLENRGEIERDSDRRRFDLVESEHLADLRDRLVIGWRSPRTWRLTGATASRYPVRSIADAEPERFPGFDWLVLSRAELHAVCRDRRYASWLTALSSVIGIPASPTAATT